jgi:hypothetical protein
MPRAPILQRRPVRRRARRAQRRLPLRQQPQVQALLRLGHRPRGRALLDKLLGDLVWHRSDSFSSLEEQLAHRGSSRQREAARRVHAAGAEGA